MQRSGSLREYKSDLGGLQRPTADSVGYSPRLSGRGDASGGGSGSQAQKPVKLRTKAELFAKMKLQMKMANSGSSGSGGSKRSSDATSADPNNSTT